MFFPAFLPITHRPLLLVGAGEIAQGKVEKLLPFQPKIQVIAREISPTFQAWADQGLLEISRRDFALSDVDSYDIVIMAIDDVELQTQAFHYCQARRILINCVDVPEYCSFIFPALIQRENFIIAVSTGGKAPFLAGTIKRWLDQIIPEGLDAVIAKVDLYRQSPEILSLQTAKERGQKVIQFAKTLITTVLPPAQTALGAGPNEDETN